MLQARTARVPREPAGTTSKFTPAKARLVMRRMMDRYAQPIVDASTFHRLASPATKKQMSGEDIMKRWLIGLLLLVGPAASAQQAAPVIPFDSAANPLRLPP